MKSVGLEDSLPFCLSSWFKPKRDCIASNSAGVLSIQAERYAFSRGLTQLIFTVPLAQTFTLQTETPALSHWRVWDKLSINE